MRYMNAFFLCLILVFVVGCEEDETSDCASGGCDASANQDDVDSDGGIAPVALADEYVLSSEDSIPEGIAFDPVDRVFYASAVVGGSITRVAADGTESLLREPSDDGASIAGIKVDAERRLLWACVAPSGVSASDSVPGEIWVFDLVDGALESEYSLGEAETAGQCNDLALDSSGVAYVTDTGNPNIYRVDHQAGSVDLFATDPLFEPIVGGLNGIVVIADGDFLLVGKMDTGELFRVSITQPDQVAAVQLDENLLIPDGLVLIGGDLYSVNDGSVQRVVFEGDEFISGSVSTSSAKLSGLSTATEAEGQLYVIKSEAAAFVVANMTDSELELDLPFKILKIDLASFQ